MDKEYIKQDRNLITSRILNLSTLALTAVLIVAVDYFSIPNPAVLCLIGVVFAAFNGGLLYGALSGVMLFGYCGYFFSTDHDLIHYTGENRYKLLVIFLAVTAMVLMVGILKKTVEIRTKELEEANRRLSLLTVLDGLTGISNRRHFEMTMDLELRRARREQKPLTLAILDIDFFKRFNDTYGHQEGDECLKKLAGILTCQIRRSTDFVGRYGGEEFAVILPNTTASKAVDILESLRRAIEEEAIPNEYAEPSQLVTVSIGVVSEVPSQSSQTADYVRKADRALYLAKRLGKNRVEISREEETESA